MLRATSAVTGPPADRAGGALPSSDSPRRRRRGLSRGAVFSRLDIDAAFFWLLLVFLVTVVSFLNLRDGNVALNASQLAEYERRTQLLSNSTVYIVEVHRPEGLLSKLRPADWARVSSAIDLVAYVFDDLPVFLSDDWVTRAEHILRNPHAAHAHRVGAGLGIVLFPCGCVLPNAYFRAVAARLGGMECLLLPGWVLPHRDVHWLPDADDGGHACKRQQRISASRVVAEYAAELSAIRRDLEAIRADLPGRLLPAGATPLAAPVSVPA